MESTGEVVQVELKEKVVKKQLQDIELCDYIDKKVMDLMCAFKELTNELSKGLNALPYTQMGIDDTYQKFIEQNKKVHCEFAQVQELIIEIDQLKLDNPDYSPPDPWKKYYF